MNETIGTQHIHSDVVHAARMIAEPAWRLDSGQPRSVCRPELVRAADSVTDDFGQITCTSCVAALDALYGWAWRLQPQLIRIPTSTSVQPPRTVLEKLGMSPSDVTQHIVFHFVSFGLFSYTVGDAIGARGSAMSLYALLIMTCWWIAVTIILAAKDRRRR